MAILCIVANQRAGTTALQSALGRSGKFLNMKEIFQATDANTPGNFPDFARARDIRLSELAVQADAERICEDYLDHIEEQADGLVPVIDVKFNSWLVLQPFWAYPHEEPAFMRALKRRGASFLFVRRRDLAAQVLSEHIARRTGIWHGMDEDEAQVSVEVNVNRVREQARLIVQAEKFFGGLLTNHPRCRSVVYEEMFRDNAIDPDLAEFRFSSVGLEPGDKLVSNIPKNAGNKAQQIANYAEALEEVEAVSKRFNRIMP